MLDAGTLRHRVTVEQLVNVMDTSGSYQTDTGELNQEWLPVGIFWASIQDLNGKELFAAQAEQSIVTTKIIIRYNPILTPDMRLYHAAKDTYYNIEGIVTDKDSGLEYMVVMCSTGVRVK
jgi:SPP1 family predicted phage head-tail adaptor